MAFDIFDRLSARTYTPKGTHFGKIKGPSSLDDRIAIVGAGPSGIHMAYKLRVNYEEMDLESLRYPSMCLSLMLDRIIGTEKTVAIRRTIDCMTYYVADNNAEYAYKYSGSRGEGLQFDSSDDDVMAVCRKLLVINSVHDIPIFRNHYTTLLLMRKDGCHPGFVILQLLGPNVSPHITQSLVDYRGVPVVSSLLFRDSNILPINGNIGHGPCTTFTPGQMDVDIAYCFECKMWPSEAYEFIYRIRKHGWPSKDLIENIISAGCHVVAVGDKGSDISHIQWRISFSVAEKALVHSFNHTQLKVYGLMKIFLKQVIDKTPIANGLLCSYFLKTTVFYAIEGTPSSFWREDLLIPCFWFCFNKLIKWVRKGICPNYFIPKNNMFRNKVQGENQRNLLVVLTQIKTTGWTSLYQCGCIQALKTFVQFPRRDYFRELLLKEFEHELIMDQAIYLKIKEYLHLIWYQCQIYPIINRILRLMIHCRSQQEKDISNLIGCSVVAGASLCYFQNGYKQLEDFSNKRKYLLFRKCEILLLPFLQSNASTGYLTLATFYLKTGQYLKVIRICKRMIATWQSYMVYHSRTTLWPFHPAYIERICGLGLSINEKTRKAFVRDIIVSTFQQNKIIYPNELLAYMEASSKMIMSIPPLPYCSFLMFLSHHELGNIDESFSALHDLQALVHDEEQGYISNHIVINLLAICLDKVGDTHEATSACLASQIIRPKNNGAFKILQNVLRKMY